MVQLTQVTDDMAEKLKLDEGSKPDKASTAAAAAEPVAGPAVAGPELPPALALNSGMTAEEILSDLNKSPLFMTELVENDDVAALQALAYEGTPLENASDFKERGNECFRASQWTDAREFYSKGIALLVAEERRRALGEAKAAGVAKGDGEAKEADSDDGTAAAATAAEEMQSERAVLEQLYSNRAACQLELRNLRACTLDCGSALRLNAANAKAWFRSARALLLLDKTDEAAAACAGGLAAQPGNAALQKLARDVEVRAETVRARKRREAARLARENRRAARLRAALQTRGIRMRTTPKPPDMEDARVRLEPEDSGGEDETEPEMQAKAAAATAAPSKKGSGKAASIEDLAKYTLTFPTLLLYPKELQSDFIKAFAETETLSDHLAYVLPPPWAQSGSGTNSSNNSSTTSTSGTYASAAAVDCFVETAAGGLVKVGKKMPLGKILNSHTNGTIIEVVDNLLRIFVLPRGDVADAWVREFKEKKAAERR